MSSLSFGAPVYLLALAVIGPMVGYALIRQERDRMQRLHRFGDEPLLQQTSRVPARRQRIVRDVLTLAAVLLILLTLARPQFGEHPSAMGRTGRDLLVVLDLSRSMNAADVEQSRLAVAKQLIRDLLRATPGQRVGLVVFGGSAFLQLPLTGNYAAFQRFLDAASTDDLGDPATDLSNALMAATTAFEHDGERGYQTVLLASDGESGTGDIGPVLNRLRQARIPVLAVGVGTAQGAPVPADSSEAPEKWHRDNIGRIVLSRLEEGDLRRAARETGGSYYHWSPAVARDLAQTLSRLDRRAITTADAMERVDRFQWPLGFAIGLLVLLPLTGARAPRTEP
ncbi:MAG: VWA domain-containing protein [Gemmatimonadales bacterium]